MEAGTHCLLHARALSLRFPGVQALDKVELCLRQGEVHALLGQNGAGGFPDHSAGDGHEVAQGRHGVAVACLDQRQRVHRPSKPDKCHAVI